MKIALMHDWLLGWTGSERVLSEILKLFPNATLFSLLDFLSMEDRAYFFGKHAKTSFLQCIPFARSLYKQLLPLMPLAAERMDFSDYDLIISSSHAVAKGILTRPDQLHICYLHARNLKYAYEDREYYNKPPFIGFIQDILLARIRKWDRVASKRPTHTISNSHFVQDWHKTKHGVSSTVIYPPVDVDMFSKHYTENKDNYYVIVSRLAPYKKIDIAIEAFSKNGKKLIIIGSGSEEAALKKRATSNIEFLGHLPPDKIPLIVAQAKAFVFTSREDFGIAPIEAQAAGTPVIALNLGAARETIRGLNAEHPTGVFFEKQTPESLNQAILEFEKNNQRIEAGQCHINSLRFDIQVFRRELKKYVDDKTKKFFETAG